MKLVLLIEDDIALRENTAELLELSNYKVIKASNGRVGISLAKEHKPDIIICDIMMPEVDGYAVLQELSTHTATRQIPFIFLSAKTGYKEVRKGMDLGADDYLTKPFEEGELISAVESRIAKATLLKNLQKINVLEISDGDPLRSLNDLKNFFDNDGKGFHFSKGDVIYTEQEHSNMVYLISRGVVKTHKMDESGKELITALYRADDFLGFTSFADTAPYQESATVLEDVHLTGVHKTELREILESSKHISLEIMELLIKHLAEIKKHLLQMAYSSVRKKTAQTILEFAHILNKDPEEGIRIARNDLASVAGIATESLIRTLSEFKKEGLIEIEGRNIRLIDSKGLELVE